MKEPKNFKEMYLWLDIEISLLHIAFYWIAALIIQHYVAYIILGVLSTITFIYVIKKTSRLVKEQSDTSEDV